MDDEDVYIGDGVYASFDGYQIWLRIGGQSEGQRIAIEPNVWSHLRDYAKSINQKHGVEYFEMSAP